jgi:hypothetical protein
VRDDAVELLTHRLAQFETHDAELNAFLVWGLLDLRATEPAAMAAMEAAHAADAVDISLCGDWEDVQVELGLLAERRTPRPRYGLGAFDTRHVSELPPRFDTASPLHRRDQSARAKKKARRKPLPPTGEPPVRPPRAFVGWKGRITVVRA